MDDTHASYVESAYAEHERIERSLAVRFPGEDAEGHVAEAYARSCEAAVRDETHAVKWVARVAGHLAIDATRAHSVARKYAPDLLGPQTSESAEDWYLRQERSRRLASALAALPPDQRDVILAVADGARAKDIANQLGRPVYAVKHLIARSRKQLRDQLRDAQLALLGCGARFRRRTGRLPYTATAAWGSALLLSPMIAVSASPFLALAVGTAIAEATIDERASTASHPNAYESAAPLTAFDVSVSDGASLRVERARSTAPSPRSQGTVAAITEHANTRVLNRGLPRPAGQ